jgi:RND superfamily putative drug exporter
MGSPVDYRNLSNMPVMMREMYMGMMVQTIGFDNRTVLISVTLQEAPFTDESRDTVNIIRDEIQSIDNPNLRTAEIYVGGSTASIVDLSEIMDRDLNGMVVVVLIGVFIVLLIVLGSVLIPLSAILTIGLTISWTVALTMFVFDVYMGIPILWMMPMILFVILMGLGLDYTIFLLTRIREERYRGKSHETAIATAVERTGSIITACGLIMACGFGTMMLSTLGLLQQFGFALAFAIILDAMIVRIYLLPAILVLLKEKSWWAPGRLQRVRIR